MLRRGWDARQLPPLQEPPSLALCLDPLFAHRQVQHITTLYFVSVVLLSEGEAVACGGGRDRKSNSQGAAASV